MNAENILSKIVKSKEEIRKIFMDAGIKPEHLDYVTHAIHEFIVDSDETAGYIYQFLSSYGEETDDDPDLYHLVSQSPSQILKETLAVDAADGFEPYVQFFISESKGSGIQRIPVSLFDVFVEFLEDFQNDPSHEYSEMDHANVLLCFSASPNPAFWKIQLQGDQVSLSTYLGKGGKPSFFPLADLSEVIEVFKSVASNIPKATNL